MLRIGKITLRFNPTLVRLAQHGLRGSSWRSIGFNPTLVRLALCQYRRSSSTFFQFQSHLGSISTLKVGKPKLLNVRFNPTLVRLALETVGYEGSLADIGFNPTLVRLAHREGSDNDNEQNRFNPTLVRLAPHKDQ